MPREAGDAAGPWRRPLSYLSPEVRLFAATPREDRSLVVVEQCYDENTGARPGIALVEQTFSLE